MHDLRRQLQRSLQGRVAWLAVGNPDGGDDAFGPALAARLAPCASEPSGPTAPYGPRGARSEGASDVWLAGVEPERLVHRLAGRYDHVVFLDAVDFGGAPGDVVFLASSELRSRFPQISTHRLALGTLAAWIESDGRARAWLLGVQPASLRPAAPLTPAVAASTNALARLLIEADTSTPCSPANF